MNIQLFMPLEVYLNFEISCYHSNVKLMKLQTYNNGYGRIGHNTFSDLCC